MIDKGALDLGPAEAFRWKGLFKASPKRSAAGPNYVSDGCGDARVGKAAILLASTSWEIAE